MRPLSDEPAVKAQYASAGNLNKRISIHEKYSVNRQGFGNWIASHCPVREGMSVLELGCGTGQFWLNREELIGKCSRIVLTDLSEGMLRTARETLKRYTSTEYAAADIQRIPYPAHSFDLSSRT